MEPRYDVIVIGGGAAGMMAAGRAAERGRRVLVLEKNEQLGVKLAISGGGRCNICNAEENPQLLLQHYGRAEKFLYSPFAQFGMTDTFEFFTAHGLPLKVESNNRAFPAMGKARAVVRTLKGYMAQGGVEVRTEAEVQGFALDGGAIVGVKVGGVTLTADSYILATGGKSHPETGSTGDGFRWLRDLGHTVQEPTPTIVPLAVNEEWIKSISGVSLDDARVTFFVGGKRRLSVKGRVLCTHFGISGPVILNAAGQVADLLHDGVVTATVDVYPELDHGALDTHIIKHFDTDRNGDFATAIKRLAPVGTAATILQLLPHIDPLKKIHSVSREERRALVNLMKGLPLTITGLMGFERAVVADGGLVLKEVEGKTMRSRKHANLFVTGDLLHISRPSGGFSLQLCWTSGWVAGSNA